MHHVFLLSIITTTAAAQTTTKALVYGENTINLKHNSFKTKSYYRRINSFLIILALAANGELLSVLIAFVNNYIT